MPFHFQDFICFTFRISSGFMVRIIVILCRKIHHSLITVELGKERDTKYTRRKIGFANICKSVPRCNTYYNGPICKDIFGANTAVTHLQRSRNFIFATCFKFAKCDQIQFFVYTLNLWIHWMHVFTDLPQGLISSAAFFRPTIRTECSEHVNSFIGAYWAYVRKRTYKYAALENSFYSIFRPFRSFDSKKTKQLKMEKNSKIE